jgi:Na+/H+-dicarboxylate symporter
MAAGLDSQLANRILLGLLGGAVAGALTLLVGAGSPAVLEAARVFAVTVLDPIGQVFLRLLFFVVMPLVFASLAAGVSQLGDLARLGPLSARTFTLFFLNMSIACALGLLMMNVLQPGAVIDGDTKTRLIEQYGDASGKLIEKQAAQPDVSFATVVDMFMPRNLIGAITGHDRATLGEVLPLILFAILVGAAAIQLVGRRREQLQSGLELITELMTGIVRFALRLAPYAVPAMIYSVVVKVGWDILIALGLFVVGDDAASLRDDVPLAEALLALPPAGFLAPHPPGAGDGVLHELEQCDLAGGLGLVARRPRHPPVHGRVRAAARCDHQHGGHRAL